MTTPTRARTSSAPTSAAPPRRSPGSPAAPAGRATATPANRSANSANEEWNAVAGTEGDCSAVAIGGGGGVASDSGTIYFLSPELLDGSGNGTADAPNLYMADPGSAPHFVATLESSLTGPQPPVEFHRYNHSFGGRPEPAVRRGRRLRRALRRRHLRRRQQHQGDPQVRPGGQPDHELGQQRSPQRIDDAGWAFRLDLGHRGRARRHPLRRDVRQPQRQPGPLQVRRGRHLPLLGQPGRGGEPDRDSRRLPRPRLLRRLLRTDRLALGRRQRLDPDQHLGLRIRPEERSRGRSRQRRPLRQLRRRVDRPLLVRLLEPGDPG